MIMVLGVVVTVEMMWPTLLTESDAGEDEWITPFVLPLEGRRDSSSQGQERLGGQWG